MSELKAIVIDKVFRKYQQQNVLGLTDHSNNF